MDKEGGHFVRRAKNISSFIVILSLKTRIVISFGNTALFCGKVLTVLSFNSHKR